VNFLVDQVDVHRLLARSSAQFVQVEVPTVNGNMAHLLAPTSSSKLDFVVARQFKETVDVFGQRRKRWRSQLRLQPRKMLENAKLLPACCGQGRSWKNANGMASAARAISTPTIGANALVEAKM
jgi:hypothetical protein